MKRASVLKCLIAQRGSVMDFSKKNGIPYNTLRSILERGVGNSSVNNVMKICEGLDITIDKLNKLSEYTIIEDGKLTLIPEGVPVEDNYNENQNDYLTALAAHHDGDEYTDEELEEIERFKEFVKSKRKNKE